MTLTHSGASELAQLMEGTTAGALIPEIVRRGLFLLKLGDSVLLIPEASLPHNQSKTHLLIITELLA